MPNKKSFAMVHSVQRWALIILPLHREHKQEFVEVSKLIVKSKSIVVMYSFVNFEEMKPRLKRIIGSKLVQGRSGLGHGW